MKKLLLGLIVLVGVSTSATAQDVGQIWVGGSVGFVSSKPKGGDAATTYKILPEFGYVISDNLGLGVRLGYAHLEGSSAKLNGVTIVGDEANAFTVSPFVRYSFLKGDIGGLFLDGGVGYTYLKEKGYDEKTNLFEVGFRPGVAVNVSDQIAFTGKFGFLGYQHLKEGDAKTNAFGFDIDLSQIELGINIIF